MKLWMLPLFLLVFASACATERAAEQKASDPNAATAQEVPIAEEEADPKAQKKPLKEDEVELVCEMENVIGSNIRRRVCRTTEEIDRERREAQDFMRRPRRQPQAAQ